LDNTIHRSRGSANLKTLASRTPVARPGTLTPTTSGKSGRERTCANIESESRRRNNLTTTGLIKTPGTQIPPELEIEILNLIRQAANSPGLANRKGKIAPGFVRIAKRERLIPTRKKTIAITGSSSTDLARAPTIPRTSRPVNTKIRSNIARIRDQR